MNDKNLIPNSERTPSELREIASKGGKKSGESRRRKKTMKQVMDMLLGMPANTPQDWQLLADLGFNLDELDEDTVNNILIVNAALLKNAKQGDVASIKELRSIIRDDDLLKHKIKTETARLELEKKKAEPKQAVENDDNGLMEALLNRGMEVFDED